MPRFTGWNAKGGGTPPAAFTKPWWAAVVPSRENRNDAERWPPINPFYQQQT